MNEMIATRQSKLERTFETHWIQLGGQPFYDEYQFHPERKWRFDFAWPREKVAVEVEGGTWKHGRHNRGAGYAADCEKYNTATLLGWRVFRLTGDMLKQDPVGALCPIIQFIRENEIW